MAQKRRRRIPRKQARSRGLRWGTLGRAALVVLLLGAAAGGVALVWLWPRCSGATCPSVEALRSYTPPQASRVLDSKGEILAHLAPERRIVVPLERIPPEVYGAFLAVEDRRFYRHQGVDYWRALGALLRDIHSMSFRQGFSTITMQLARNVFPEHLSREKTLRRKLWEVMLAREIEREFSKEEILELYLNQIYLGEGLYGVEAAARGYFGKPATALSTEEAAMLAALPKAPSTYDPRHNRVAAVRRRNLVLGLMADAGVISAGEADEAAGRPLALAPPLEAKGAAPYLVAEVRQELRERFGADAETQGLRVYTSVDRSLQDAAQQALREQIAAVEAGKLGRYRRASCSSGKVKDPGRCLQGLFVAMDVRTGDVLALVGGRDFSLSQFDRVTQARRQAGSAFKPFVYATALAQGIPITTPLVGAGADSYDGDYRPNDHVQPGQNLDLRGGLRVSSNTAAVVLGERVGVQNVVQTAHALGLTTPIKEYPSTFLGAADVIPLEMVAAYSAFANYGELAAPRIIRRVEDAHGKLLWEAPVRRHSVLSPAVAFLTTSLMRDAVDHGTGWRVRESLPYEVPAAGKTGTTNESADAWFVGYTPDVVAGAWIGLDRPERIMAGADGGKLAAPVWGRVLASYYRSHPVPAPWQPPIELVTAQVDRTTGMLATSACPPEEVASEWFLPGTEPQEYCTVHPEPGFDSWFRRRMDDLRGIFN